MSLKKFNIEYYDIVLSGFSDELKRAIYDYTRDSGLGNDSMHYFEVDALEEDLEYDSSDSNIPKILDFMKSEGAEEVTVRVWW